MKWISEHQKDYGKRFEITKDKKAGYYLYIYKNGTNTHDYLQDTLETAME